MITRDDAINIVATKLKEDEPEVGLELAIVQVIEEDFGWVFFYSSKLYVDSGGEDGFVIGNGPIIVDRRDGKMHIRGSGFPSEYYIEEFRREWKNETNT